MWYSLLISAVIFSVSLCGSCMAEKVLWAAEVSSLGKPTESIHLDIGKRYRIEAGGMINLGKWWQKSQPLANDACYEFTKSGEGLSKVETLKNSINMSVCDGTYHADHVYRSVPFTAVQSGIHFWVYDTNYDDNSGAFNVQIIELD